MRKRCESSYFFTDEGCSNKPLCLVIGFTDKHSYYDNFAISLAVKISNKTVRFGFTLDISFKIKLI